MENEEKQLIETIDENGNKLTFELYDIVEVDSKEYALLIDAENDEDEDEITLMRLTQDGEEYVFESIDDEEEFNKVAAYVESMDEDEEE